MREFDFELTRRCNLKCGYCYLGQTPSYATASATTIEQVLDFVARFADPTRNGKPTQMNFYGGEPLMAYDELRQVVDSAKRRGLKLRYTAVTNGTIATDAMAAYFRANGVSVARSIDGCPAALAINRPDIIPAYKRATAIYHDENKTRRATVSPGAAKYLLESARFFRDGLGLAKGGTFIPDFYATWSEQEQRDFLDQLWAVAEEYVRDFKAGRPFYFYWFDREKRRFELKDRKPCGFGCGAGRSMVAINCHGYIFPCHRFTTEPIDGPFCAGHVADAREKIAFGQPWQEWLAFMAAGQQHVQCSSCIASLTCTDGCCHTNLKATGTLDQPVPLYCRIKREASKVVAWIDSQLRHVDSAWYTRPGSKKGGNAKGKQNGSMQIPSPARAGQQTAGCRHAAALPVPAVRQENHDGQPPANYTRCVRCGGHRPAVTSGHGHASPGGPANECRRPDCAVPGEQLAEAAAGGGDSTPAGSVPGVC